VIQFTTLIPLLVNAGGRFILVGGAAAIAHGSSRLTNDLDIVYDRSQQNIERMVDALKPYQSPSNSLVSPVFASILRS